MRYLLLALPLLLLTLGCNKKAATAATDAPLPANLKIITFGDAESLALGTGVKVAKSDVTLEFTDVVSDNRCPKNVNCIQAGEAKVTVLLDGKPRTVILDADNRQIASVSFTGGTFRFTGLTPYPESGQRIDPTQRRLKVELIESARMR